MEDITLASVEYLTFQLSRKLMSSKESAVDFSTRYPHILESCLSVPFPRLSHKSLHRGLVSKAAVLFYLLVKNRSFNNSNKRVALATLFVFLYLNKRWLKVDSKELYNFCVWVAQSPTQLKEETVKAVEKFIHTYLVDLKK